jgi:hypothetical protein
MSDPDALQDEMRRLLLGELGVHPAALDGDTVDRLLAGRLEPDDAPPGYAEVAAVLQAAAGPPSPGEVSGEASAVATFVAMTHPRSGPRGRATERRRAYGSRLAVLAAAALGVLLVGGAAAAATGTLPEPARRVVDSVSRAAHHQPARSAVDRRDQGEVRSDNVSPDGAAVGSHSGAGQKAHHGRPAPLAPTGPDATGSASDGTCVTALAGRGGVSCSKEVKPKQQVHQPAPKKNGQATSTPPAKSTSSAKPTSTTKPTSSTKSSAPTNASAPANASAPSAPSAKQGGGHRQKESGPPGPEGGRR